MSELSLWATRGVTPDGVVEGLRLLARNGRIAELAHAPGPQAGDEVFENATLLPGLVDLQVNGGDGAGYDAVDAAERARATEYHARRGTTSLLATLVTAPLDELQSALARLADDVDPDGPVVGVHLEGPFLSESKAGAHARAWLCDPSSGTVESLIAKARGTLRMVTLAPELPGACEAIERFVRAGAVVAAGHSTASLEQLRRAMEAGLDFITHVGNASDWPSRPFDERLQYRRSEPGLVGAFLFERRLRGSLILDGLHLHPELAGAIVALRGPDSVALVSDATAAAGLPAGRSRLGALEVQIHDGGYATAGQGLAGSVITLLEAVRVAVESAGLPLELAVRMAATTPARIAGLANRKGALRIGGDADLVLIDADWTPRSVYRLGRRL